MSNNVVDQRVVEMRFDNKNFESNVSTTMSTLDKLKAKLNLEGTAKGFEQINTSARNVNMNVLSSAVEGVSNKFSALQVIGITALANLTNSAVNAGKQFVNALTVEPVKTGFSEYELKIDSIRTIAASTGEELSVINDLLNELNTYSDQTIYSFSDMTQNIGKFTNAGVKLEDAVLAIKGISNEAAVSGANANEASRAMYNFAQALSAGYVKLIDWKSIELANMATKEFKQQLIDTAVELGTLTETSDGLYSTGKHTISATKDFNDSLTDQWMTTEVLIQTLGKYADATTDIGKKAFAAAQDVTKFSQVFDILKETAQSGWARTWELLIGDIDQAKALLTPLTNFLSGVIESVSNFRNDLLEGALGKGYSGLSERLVKMATPIVKAGDLVKRTTENVKNGLLEVDKVTEEIIEGIWGNGLTRITRLTQSYYNVAQVQNKVNEKLGDSTRHAEDYEEVLDEISEVQLDINNLTESEIELQAYQIEQLGKKSKEQLKLMGYTMDEIADIRILTKLSKDLGVPMQELIANIDEVNGRWLLVRGFTNIGESILSLLNSIKTAWSSIFPAATSDTIFNLITGFNKLTNDLSWVEDHAESITNVFEGLFAILNIVASLTTGALGLAIRTFTQILGAFDLDVITFAGNVGLAIRRLSDWLNETLDFTEIFKKMIPYIEKAVEVISDWVQKNIDVMAMHDLIVSKLKLAKEAFLDWIDGIKSGDITPKDVAESIVKGIEYAINYIKDIISNIKDYISGKTDEIPTALISGIANGIWSGIKFVGEVFVELGKIIIQRIKDVLGIHSPSKVFFAIGAFCIAGFLGGISAGKTEIGKAIAGVFGNVIEWVKSLDFGTALSAALGIGMVVALFKVLNVLKSFASPFEGIGGVLDGVSDSLESFSKKLKADALKSIAISIAILVASLIALAYFAGMEGNITNLGIALGAIVLLSAILIGLSWAIGRIGAISFVGNAGIAFMMTSLAGMMLTMALVAKIMSGINEEDLKKGIKCVRTMGILILALVGISKFADPAKVNSISKLMLSVAGSLLIMAVTAKILAGMSWEEFEKATYGLALFGTVMVALMLAAKLAGHRSEKSLDGVGGTLLAVAGAMAILVIVSKMIARMSWEDMGKAAVGLVGLSIIITVLIAATRLASGGDKLKGTAATIFAVGASMFLLVLVAKMISKMEWSEMEKAAVGITFLGLIITGLIAATNLATTKDLAKVGATILAISISIGLLALVASILGLLPVEQLAKGIIAVAILGLIIDGILISSKFSKSAVGNIIVMTIAIAVLTASLAILSNIPSDDLMAAAKALGIVMVAFALMIASTKFSTGSLGTIIALTVVMGLMAGLLYAMNKLKVKGSIETAGSLSIMLLALSAAAVILSKMGKMTLADIGKSFAMLVALTAVMALLGLVLAMMSELNVQNGIENALVLSGLMAVLTGVAVVMSIFGGLGTNILQGALGMGALVVVMALVGLVLAMMSALDVKNGTENALILAGLMIVLTVVAVVMAIFGALGPAMVSGAIGMGALVVVMALVGLVLAMMSALDIQNAQSNTDLLIGIMTTLTKICVVLAIVGPLALVGVVAVAALVLLMGAIGLLAVAIGYLITESPQIEDFLDKGIPILEKLAKAVGSLIGNFIAGFAEGVLSIIPMIGTALSEFMFNLIPFIVIAQTINNKVLEGVGILTASILALTVAEFIEGIASFTSLGLALPLLGLKLSMFMNNAKGFIDGASSLTPSVLNAASTIADMVITLTKAGSGKSLSKLGKEIEAFGPSIKAYSDSVSGIEVGAVLASAKAVTAIAELAKSFPTTGGIKSWFVGNVDTEAFGNGIKAVGEGMKAYSDAVGDTTFNAEAIYASVDVAKALAQMADATTKFGGLVGFLEGETDLSKFGADLEWFGLGLKNYSASVEGINKEAIDVSAEAGIALGKMADATPKFEGLAGFLAGETDIKRFGAQLVWFGVKLKAYSDIVAGGIDTAAIDTSVEAGKKLADLNDATPKYDGLIKGLFSSQSDIKTFGQSLVTFAQSMVDYQNTIENLDSSKFSSATTQFMKLMDLAERADGVSFDSLGYFGNSMKDLAVDAISSFINAFDDSHGDVIEAGRTFIEKLVVGAESKAWTILRSFSELTKKAITGVEANYTAMVSSGKYLIDGLVAGLKDPAKLSAVYSAGYALGQKAIQGERAGQQSNSPSKLAIQSGKWIGEGLVIGMEKMTRSVYNAGNSIGSTAVSPISSAISKVTDLLDSGIDTTPTIRPVLDLSDVRNGIGSIDGMLSANRSVGVMANLNSIGFSMNNRQNGSNSDVISAIKSLGQSLGKVGGDTYNINGVNYEEASDVEDAFKTIIRAARIERRS